MTLNTIVCVEFHHNSILLYPFFLAKFSRQNSIHVSPTAMWDGLICIKRMGMIGLKRYSLSHKDHSHVLSIKYVLHDM
jgi:hypothetical protein